MKLLFTIRTANRAPKRNYLARTVHSLLVAGVSPDDLHLVPTDDHVQWLLDEVRGVDGLQIHVPGRRRTPNENGLAQIDLLRDYPADWIVMTEDDLEWCSDPFGSITRWLERHATPHHLLYRFFSFGSLTPRMPGASEAPLAEQRGSQAVALRADDALRFARWARQHRDNWRPAGAPFQHRPHDGFDKLLGYWALQDRPAVTTGLVSRPFFVRHLGVESSLHPYGARRDAEFGGVTWSYGAEVSA